MKINLESEHNLEIRVCLSLITSQPIEINNIAVTEGGLKAHQISLLELFNKITSGASYNINETGCRLRVTPGTLIGGEIEHECDNGASLGYYSLYLILLAPFCQKPLEATLTGVTNKSDSLSVERLNFGLRDFVKAMVGEASIFTVEVKKRGAFPGGGGEAHFSARPVVSLKPLKQTKVGKVQKVKGVSWTTRLNCTLGKRTIDGAKKNFKDLISDFYIRLDHSVMDKSGKSPGFGLCLVALTTEGGSYSVELASKSQEEFDGEPSVPEEVGETAVEMLKREIVRGGAVSSDFEPIVMVMMALGKCNVSKLVVGVPGDGTKRVLRDLVLFTGVKFNMTPLKEGMEGWREGTGQELLVTCVGCGLVNLNRAIH